MRKFRAKGLFLLTLGQNASHQTDRCCVPITVAAHFSDHLCLLRLGTSNAIRAPFLRYEQNGSAHFPSGFNSSANRFKTLLVSIFRHVSIS